MLADRAMAEVTTTGADVPPLFLIEVANVLLMSARRRRIPDSAVAAGLADLRRMDLRLDLGSAGETLAETVALADAHQLTAYDAAYLELARRLNAPLATLDQPLANAARAVGIRLFTA